jgi:indole-3-glycerol phosphate synthase
VLHKRREVALRKEQVPLEELEARIENLPTPRSFLAALRGPGPIRLIAEVKKASPSRGVIRDDFDPVKIATIYEAEGASCISVLTDERYFQGCLAYLEAIRKVVSLPLLRKDFIIDPYQLFEARAAGADAVLLIAECLGPAELSNLFRLALQLELTPLVEVHDPQHLQRVVDLPAPLIGINNRDLRTFRVDLDHSIRLREKIPPDRVVVSESGIRTRQDLDRLEAAGIQAVLVGETLMAAPDIAQAVRNLLGRSSHNPQLASSEKPESQPKQGTD